jgi:hypothetical protein
MVSPSRWCSRSLGTQGLPADRTDAPSGALNAGACTTDPQGVNGDERDRSVRWPLGTGLLLLTVRGLLLWLVVPALAIVWLLTWPLWRRRGVTLGQLLGWADLNLVSALGHTLLRPLTPTPLPWTPLAEANSVTHRIGFLDPP